MNTIALIARTEESAAAAIARAAELLKETFAPKSQALFNLIPGKEYKVEIDDFSNIAGEFFVSVSTVGGRKNVRIERFEETPEVVEALAKVLG